jgi:nucleotide-binding universal stress UspA family protein
MTFVVPFDGSVLAQAALSRAVAFAGVADERVVAVAVVPVDNAAYARDRGWLSTGEPFDREAVVGRLRGRVSDLARDVTFRTVFVDRDAPSGAISTRIRRVLAEEDASMVFVGSDTAGRIAASVASVGNRVGGDPNYDAVIVRTPGPSPVAAIREQEPLAAADGRGRED